MRLFDIFQFSYTTSCFLFSVIRAEDKKIPPDTHSLPSLVKLQRTLWQWEHMQAQFADTCAFLKKVIYKGKAQEREHPPQILVTTRLSEWAKEINFPRGQWRKQVKILPLLLRIPQKFQRPDPSCCWDPYADIYLRTLCFAVHWNGLLVLVWVPCFLPGLISVAVYAYVHVYIV